jgi:hypothetical protein
MGKRGNTRTSRAIFVARLIRQGEQGGAGRRRDRMSARAQWEGIAGRHVAPLLSWWHAKSARHSAWL